MQIRPILDRLEGPSVLHDPARGFFGFGVGAVANVFHCYEFRELETAAATFGGQEAVAGAAVSAGSLRPTRE